MKSLLSTRNILRVVGLLLFGFILWRIDHHSLIDVLSGSSLSYILLGILTSFPLVLIRSFRWNKIKQFLEVKVSLSESIFLQFVGQMAFLTPGKVGELIKAFYLKGDGHSLGRSVVSIIGDRIYDLVTISLIAFVSSFYFFKNFYLTLGVPGAITVGLITVGVVSTVLYRRRILDLIKTLLMMVLPSWLETKTDELLSSLETYFQKIRLSGLCFLFLVSVLAFTVQVLRIFCFAEGLGMSVSLVPFGGVIAIMSISNLLPISFMGLGTRDAVFLYFFGLLGVDSERAIALSLIVLGSLILNTLLGSLLFVIKPPKLQVAEYLKNLRTQTQKN